MIGIVDPSLLSEGKVGFVKFPGGPGKSGTLGGCTAGGPANIPGRGIADPRGEFEVDSRASGRKGCSGRERNRYYSNHFLVV